MKLGLTLGYAGPQLNTTVAELVNMEKIGEVERLGYDSIWTAESWGNDAVTPLAWVGPQTWAPRSCSFRAVRQPMPR